MYKKIIISSTILLTLTIALLIFIKSNNEIYADIYETNETVEYEKDNIAEDIPVQTELYILNFSDFLTKEQLSIGQDFIENVLIEFGITHENNTAFTLVTEYMWHILRQLGTEEDISNFIIEYDNMPFDETTIDPIRIIVKMIEIYYLDFFEATYLARGELPGGEQQRENTWFRRPLVLNN